jgi:lysozyme family protein
MITGSDQRRERRTRASLSQFEAVPRGAAFSLEKPMRENFDSPVLPFTLKYEGGRADDPRDPGGRTNEGITQSTYTAYLRESGKPEADVFAMPDHECNAIYRSHYWDAVAGNDLPSGVDLACFDLGVNSGPARALSYLGAAGGPSKAAADPAAAVQAICAKRLSFLHALHTFETFGRGWTARVAACEALGVKMALHARAGQPVNAAPSQGATLVLGTEAKKAAATAARHAKAATGAAAGSLGAGSASPMLPATQSAHLPWLPMLLAGLAMAAVAAALAWRAFQHRTRAAAYAAAAS